MVLVEPKLARGQSRYARNNQALVLGVHKTQLQSMANAARAMDWHNVRHLAWMGGCLSESLVCFSKDHLRGTDNGRGPSPEAGQERFA